MGDTGVEEHESTDAPSDETAETAGSLEQVQELLFGARARALEKALRALDERQVRDLHALQSDMEQRLERLHTHVLQELTVHENRMAVDRQERADALGEVRRELREAMRGFERRVERLEESTVAAHRELRERLYEQGGSFMEELRKLREEIAASTALEVGGLRAAKADRTTIARLLAEVAERLETGAPAEERGVDLH